MRRIVKIVQSFASPWRHPSKFQQPPENHNHTQHEPRRGHDDEHITARSIARSREEQHPKHRAHQRHHASTRPYASRSIASRAARARRRVGDDRRGTSGRCRRCGRWQGRARGVRAHVIDVKVCVVVAGAPCADDITRPVALGLVDAVYASPDNCASEPTSVRPWRKAVLTSRHRARCRARFAAA